MKRRNFLLSLPLIGLAAKAIAKPDEGPLPLPTGTSCRILKVKKCEGGHVIIWDSQTEKFVYGNVVLTEDARIEFK